MEYVNLNNLHFMDRNPRKHSAEQLQALVDSINEFGFLNPLIIDENNVILVGNGRAEAARAAGFVEVPVIRVTSLSEDEKRAFAIIENKLTEEGGWDYYLLNSELESIGLDMTRFGFAAFEAMPIAEDAGEIETVKNTNKEFSFDVFDDETFQYTCDNCGFRFNG